jgi:DivIVA domain-containing protein
MRRERHLSRGRPVSKGYDVEQVESFLNRARSAYEENGRGPAMTSWHVRTVGFDLVRGGYDVDAVDAALDRIEDAFARREKQRGEERSGSRRWQTQLRTQEQSLRAQLGTPDGERFPRGNGMELTYDVEAGRRALPADRGRLRDGPPTSARRRPARRVQEPPRLARVPRGVGRRLPRPGRRAARGPTV